MALRALLFRVRLASLSHHHHYLRRSLSAATPPPDESPPPHPSTPPTPPANSKLFVAGLSWSADERSLMDAFSSFGTVTEVVQACAHLGDGRIGRLVHNQIVIRGFSGELPLVNSLITMYAKCEDLSSARMLFDGTGDKSLVSWTVMVSAYVENGNALEGMHLFAKMRHEGLFMIDSVTLVTLLLVCYKIAKFDLCIQLHGYCYRSGLYLYRPVFNTLMAVYGKCGYVTLAHKVFDEMISRDSVSWNTMILSYGINGQGEKAVALFNEMEKSSEYQDNVTYLNTLLACSHSGLVDDGMLIFRRMINEKGINPCPEHVGCIVDMLARAGRLDEAAEVAILTHSKIGSNAWKALMGGSHLHGDMEFTKAAAEK